VGAVPWAASGATDRVHLPTVADALPFAPGTELILNGAQGVETQLPGRVADEEHVRVDLQADGSVAAVEVTQRLTLSGLGDFSFKVAGPASDVQALPESANQPGLRRGAVLWQGFSPGEKVLAARMTLFPDQEAKRLPLRFDLAMAVGGAPLAPGARRTGPLELTLRVTNVSAVPIAMVDVPTDPAELAPVLDAIHASLARGERPAPGEGGIPGDVAATGTRDSRSEDVEAPFKVAGEIVFPAGSLIAPSVSGGRSSSEPDGLHVRFERLLGGGSPLVLSIRIHGRARGLGLPVFTATASPAPPRAAVVKPPTPAGWTAAVATDPGSFEGSTMLAEAMSALWRVARLGQFDAYLGNPDPFGTSTTTYAFRLAPRAAPPPEVAAFGGPIRPMGLITLALFLLLMLFGGALVWARS
jgi:hypothetical protein